MGYCSKCYKELVRDASLTSSISESLKQKEQDEEIGMHLPHLRTLITRLFLDLEEEGDLDLGLGKLISRRTLLAAAKRYENPQHV